jgi:GAF domain-containing protein
MEMIAKDLGMAPARVSEMIQANAKEAAKTAAAFGATSASRLIPLRPAEEGRPVAAQPAPEPALEEAAFETSIGDGKASEPEYHEPDPALQLKILRELSIMLSEQPDLNLLVSVVMEGIFRGVGMDRAVFALLTPDRRWLKAKYALGCSSCRTEDMRQGFAFEMSRPNLFSHVLDTRQPLWVRREPGEPLAKLLTPEIRALTRDAPFFVIPLVVDRQVIGLVYGDRQPSARELDEESFSSFNHFCQQAILGLSYYGRSG